MQSVILPLDELELLELESDDVELLELPHPATMVRAIAPTSNVAKNLFFIISPP